MRQIYEDARAACLVDDEQSLPSEYSATIYRESLFSPTSLFAMRRIHPQLWVRIPPQMLDPMSTEYIHDKRCG